MKHPLDEKLFWNVNKTNLKKQHKGKVTKVNTNTKDAIKEITKIFLLNVYIVFLHVLLLADNYVPRSITGYLVPHERGLNPSYSDI
jgi:hypothetical protein